MTSSISFVLPQAFPKIPVLLAQRLDFRREGGHLFFQPLDVPVLGIDLVQRTLDLLALVRLRETLDALFDQRAGLFIGVKHLPAESAMAGDLAVVWTTVGIQRDHLSGLVELIQIFGHALDVFRASLLAVLFRPVAVSLISSTRSSLLSVKASVLRCGG